MRTRIAILLILALCSNGCIAAGAAVAAHRVKERREATRASTQATDTGAYSQYVSQMEQANSQRQKDGLKPQPILSYEEWQATQ